VAGKGIEILRKAGLVVVTGVCASEKRLPSEFRNVFAAKHRPFVQLKFAKSVDGYMGLPGQQVWFSNHFSQVVAHKGRSEYDAILVGTETALTDNPSLTNRFWFGKSPLRIVLDRHRRLPKHLKIFQDGHITWVVCEKKLSNDKDSSTLHYLELDFDKDLLDKLLALLFQHQISSLIVEGGAITLQQFLEKDLWDEAAIFSTSKRLGKGILAPTPLGMVLANYELGNDVLTILRNQAIGR
jgi:diaminohydroxyphosphoribosylaminopyrimidine deaminase/5-amino-6-(5-phosphoribosylamino)uracil reductase